MPNQIVIPLNKELQLKQSKWIRIRDLISNDETAFMSAPFCIRLPDESQAAYDERRKYFPANMINPSQDLVSAPGDTLFKNGYKEDVEENSIMATFMRNCTRSNDAIPFGRYLRDYVSVGLRAYGTVFTLIEKPATPVSNRAQERKEGMPFLVNLHPLDVVNFQYVDDRLVWFAYKRKYGDTWLDPRDKIPEIEEVTAVYTEQDYFLVDKNGKIISDSVFNHSYGFVPVVIQASFLASPDNTIGEWAFDQTSNMLITANNLNHIAVYELLKHGNALLLMHEESINASNMFTDKDGQTKLKKQSKGRVLAWSGEKEPHYLVKQLEVESARTMARDYFNHAVENERDLKSVAKKGTNGEMIQESGFAKLVDREPLEGNLYSLADDLEMYSAKVIKCVQSILKDNSKCSITFSRKFDLRTFKQKLEEIDSMISTRMGQVSPTGLTIAFKSLTPEITTNPDEQAAIQSEMEDNVPIVFGEMSAMRDELLGEGNPRIKLMRLKQSLQRAIAEDNSEEADSIRKQIAEIEAQIASQEGGD